ncbi:uncharacterized protein [Diadema antillarum]|uniref:uncharacterized protein n=1 Tax=Diadema antillarum TaxID=105358 RepID=UPI003A8B437F
MLISGSEAASETTAIIVLSVATAIPALFLLTCCGTLIFICRYRNKIPIFKTAVRQAKKGGKSSAGGQTPKSAPPPPPGYPYQQGQPGMPPPAGQPTAPTSEQPSAPPAEQPPGGNGMENPVDVDEVVVPIQKD